MAGPDAPHGGPPCAAALAASRPSRAGSTGRPTQLATAVPHAEAGAKEAGGGAAADAETKDAGAAAAGAEAGADTTDAGAEEEAGGRSKWERLLNRIIARKRWAAVGHAQNYAKNGMPKNLDGPATGFGRHIGRWQWREIRAWW